MTVTTYRVAGMSCEHCVAAVSAEVGAIPGVDAVTVDLAAGAVTVDSTQPLDPSVVAAAVDEAGFELVE